MTTYFLILVLASTALGEEPTSGTRVAPPLEAVHYQSPPAPLSLEPPHTLWNREEREESALFISEELILKSARGALPADAYCLRALSRAADFYKMATSPETWYIGLPKEGCSFTGSRLNDSTVDHKAEILLTVQSASLLLTAKVRSARIGWNCHRSRVERAVVVDLLEVLKGDLPEEESTQVLFLDKGGSITFEGRRLCTFPVHDQYRPRIGDTVVIAARRFNPENRLLQAVTVLPTKAGSTFWLTDSAGEAPGIPIQELLAEVPK